MRLLLCTFFITIAVSSIAVNADTGSRLLTSGGITGIEGSAGGGLTPWAVIGGYGSQEQINGTAALQRLQLGDYQLTTAGVLIGFYDRFELSVQRQTLTVSSRVTSDAVSALLPEAIKVAAPGDITQDVLGVKGKLFGDVIFSENIWMPQMSAGIQFKKNHDFATSLSLSDGSVFLPGQGIPAILGARDDSGTDVYISASKLWLGGAMGNNVLMNLTARATKANALGLLGFGTSSDNSYSLEFEGSVVLLPSAHIAMGIEWRRQGDRLGGPAQEQTAYDIFLAYFPDKSLSVAVGYVDLGSLPFEKSAKGLYVSLTGNW
jgi:hypothetical protein